MDQGYSTDYRQPPSPKDVQLVLGSSYPLWERLTGFIEENYQITGTWSSWGPSKSGWGLRYRRKGRALVALYPQRESFIAQVVLGKVQAEQVSSIKLGKQVRMILNESPQLRDGRWLWIPVLNQVDVDDVQKLLLVKMQPPSGASMKVINMSR